MFRRGWYPDSGGFRVVFLNIFHSLALTLVATDPSGSRAATLQPSMSQRNVVPKMAYRP